MNEEMKLRKMIERLVFGSGHSFTSAEYRDNWYGRELHITPFNGNYGMAGQVICVNGSPPQGTIVAMDRGLSVNLNYDCFFIHDGRSKHLQENQSEIVTAYLESRRVLAIA